MRAVDDDDPGLAICAKDFAQPCGHFTGGFDAGKAAPCNHHRVARRGVGQGCQVLHMGFQALGLFNGVDIEGVRLQTGNIRQVERAAGSQYQCAVAQCGKHPRLVQIVDGLLCNVNLLGQARYELHAGFFK